MGGVGTLSLQTKLGHDDLGGWLARGCVLRLAALDTSPQAGEESGASRDVPSYPAFANFTTLTGRRTSSA